MIHQILLSKRKYGSYTKTTHQSHNSKPPAIVTPPLKPTITAATTSNTLSSEIFAEALRRDKIIRAMVKDIKYKVGDVCTPHDKKLYDEYGKDIEVTGICDTYVKYGRDEKWPKNDTPMIVHARSIKTGTNFICTPEWLLQK